MHRLFLSFIILSIALIACKDGKHEVPVKKSSRHSESFNGSVRSAVEDYYSLTEAFVNWDSVAVAVKAKDLSAKLDQLKLDELEKDTLAAAKNSIQLSRRDLDAMAGNSSLTDKRHELNSLTQNLFDFLRIAQYDEKKIYLQLCPMAFNDEDSGVWLSQQDSIRNPYTGLHHPRYGKAMIDCGENKATLDFTR